MNNSWKLKKLLFDSQFKENYEAILKKLKIENDFYVMVMRYQKWLSTSLTHSLTPFRYQTAINSCIKR